MLIKHKTVADTAVKVMEVIAASGCNYREAREALRAAISQLNNITVTADDYRSKIYDDLKMRYNDENLSECSSVF